MNDTIETLSIAWMTFKEAERIATEDRREIEDKLLKLIAIKKPDGTETIKSDSFVIKVTSRIDHKINSDMLQELAFEYGLTDHLSRLFRWKPEINMTAWKASEPSITQPLMMAITDKPARPSFSITKKED